MDSMPLSVRLPHSLHRQLQDLARREGVSIDSLIATAAAEKVAALLTEDDLSDRAAFDAALARVPDRPPKPGDERR